MTQVLWEVKIKPVLLVKWVNSLNRAQFFVTPWIIDYQAPLSMEFSRQEHWSGLPFPSPEDLPDPGIEPRSPTLQADALTSAPPGNVGCHFLLQRIFPAQGCNLLLSGIFCLGRQILDQGATWEALTTTQMPINWWLDSQNVVHLCNSILLY